MDDVEIWIYHSMFPYSFHYATLPDNGEGVPLFISSFFMVLPFKMEYRIKIPLAHLATGGFHG
jgi:hypothetical protein